MRDIGKNIRDLREQKRLTQDQLAEQLFVTRQTVSNYETGRSRPDVDMLLHIAAALETDVNTILYGIPVPEGRKKDRRRLCWGFVLSAVLAVSAILCYCLSTLLGPRYNLYSLSFARIAILPLGYLIWGWTTLQLTGFLLGRQIPVTPWMKCVRRIILAVLAICLLWAVAFIGWCAYVTILSLTSSSVSESFDFLTPLTQLFTLIHATHLSPLFLLPGAALWMLGFPSRTA